MNRPSFPVTTVPVAVLDPLLVRALCRGESDDADRASIELYLLLLPEMERDVGQAHAPCLVATLMFAMARRFLRGAGSTPATAAVASCRRTRNSAAHVPAQPTHA